MLALSVLALAAAASAVPYMGAPMMPGYMLGGKLPYYGKHMMPDMSLTQDEKDADLILNCNEQFFDLNSPPNLISAIAVNIEQEEPDMDFKKGYGYGYGMPGLGMMKGYGYGPAYGMAGMAKMGYGGMGVGHSEKKTLSASIEVQTNGASGTGFIVFTERARPGEGCTAATVGDVLVAEDKKSKMPSYGYGMFPKFGYGYGSPMMGAMGAMGGYGGHHGHHFDDDAGIVAEVQITSGQKTTVNVDNLDFKNIKDLAGRGVAICSEVTYDSMGIPTCVEPYYSCCALKWDNKNAILA